MNEQKRKSGPRKGPKGRRPDIAGTAEALGVTGSKIGIPTNAYNSLGKIFRTVLHKASPE